MDDMVGREVLSLPLLEASWGLEQMEAIYEKPKNRQSLSRTSLLNLHLKQEIRI